MYGNLTKARWRATVWSDLAKLADRAGWIVSLAGMRFADRRLAKRFGFEPSRIIGVDVDPDVVRHNGQHGRTVIQASLSDVIYHWPQHERISVINADYCGNGGSEEVMRLFDAWLLNPACKGSYLVLNVSVGHERGSFREWLDALRSDKELKNVNRAMAATWRCLSESIRRFYCVSVGIDPFSDRAVTDSEMQSKAVDAAFDFTCKHVVNVTQYKAHKHWMDGAIVRHCFDLPAYEYSTSNLPRSPEIKRHIAAKLAWQTRRAGALH